MADFNPTPQIMPVPNLEQLARPTYFQPGADKSAAISGEGVAKAFTQGMDNMDKIVKENIDDQVHKKVDVERDSFTSALDTYRTAQLGGTTPDTGTTQVSTSPDTKTPPKSVDTGIASAQALQDALSSKKISETYYYGQLNSIAKNLRSTYPGWVDYIDGRMKEVTGVDPANAYMKSIITDIQNANANKLKEHDQLVEMGNSLIKEGVPDAYKAVSLFQRGTWSPDQFRQWANGANAEMYKNKNISERITTLDKMDAYTQRKSVEGFDQMATDDLTRTFTAHLDDTKIKSPQDISAWIQQVQEHPDQKGIAESAQKFGLQLQANAQNFYNMRLAKDSQINPKTGESVITMMGGRAKWEEHMKSVMTPFQQTAEALQGGKFDVAGLYMRQVAAVKAGAEHAMYSDLKISEQTARMDAMLKTLPPEFKPIVAAKLLQSDVPANAMNWVVNGTTSILNPPPGQPATSIDTLIRDGKARGYQDPRIFRNILGNIDYLTDPKADINTQLKVAHSFFSQENSDMLRQQNFERDHVDPVTHQWVKGQYAIFATMGGQKIVDTMTKLRDNGHPQEFTDYRNWMEDTAENHLFSKELMDLKDVTDGGIAKLVWNDKTNEFTALNSAGLPMSLRNNTLTSNAVYRINMMTKTLAGVEEASGSTGTAYLTRLLAQRGMTLNNKTGTMMLEAIKNASSGTLQSTKAYQDRVR